MSPTRLVGVVGGSGFIGSAVVDALIVGGCSVQVVRSPRLPRMSPSLATRYVESGPRVLDELIDALERCDVVINAAGSAHAASRDLKALTSANAAVPAIVAAAARAVGAKRYVHVSSAAVQGRRQVLDASRHYDPFSDYSRSKVLGEDLVDKYASDIAVVYRPPSVHGVGRSQTRSVARFAASPLGSVAGPGTSPSPQALVGNIGSAVAFLATTTQQPPSIVSHPWEGLTVADVMELMGGRRPVQVPQSVARVVVKSLVVMGKFAPAVRADARRLELLWFGQEQAISWLDRAGWSPPFGRASWIDLGQTVRAK